MKMLATVVLALAAGSATAGVVFEENFNSGDLGDFVYFDYKTDEPSSFQWASNLADGLGNFTGGDGACAMSNSENPFKGSTSVVAIDRHIFFRQIAGPDPG